jgi:hypothetical protein
MGMETYSGTQDVEVGGVETSVTITVSIYWEDTGWWIDDWQAEDERGEPVDVACADVEQIVEREMTTNEQRYYDWCELHD